jgi:hypothetical protein
MTIAEKYNNIAFNLANTEDPPVTSFNFKKANTNDIAKLIYDEVNNNIQAAKKAGRIAANEDLNALGITAQILFETGYGKSELSSKYNNFGGLRADKNWKGQVVDMVNKQTKQSYQWRAYPTVSDGIKAQVDFYIDNGRYRKNGVFNAKTPQDHINAVAKAGYAGGESDYVKKVNTVLETLPKKLSNYDPNILKQWEEYKSQAASNPPIEYKQQAPVYNIQAPSLPKIRPYFDKGLGLTTEIDKNHEIIQAMENANRSEYLEKQVDKIEKPLFEALLKPIKFAQGGNMQHPPDWLKWAQLKNPKLQVMPYYSNSMTGLLSPSLEIGASGTAGKKDRWTIKPHLGLGYQSNYKIPISGGLDAGYKGILSPNQRGNASINVGAGFHPNQGLGIGFEAGYKYRLGQSNSRNNNLRVNKAALDLMPYAGWQAAVRPENAELANITAAQLSGSQNPQALKLPSGEDYHIGPIYGINAKAQWRPKLGRYSPLTFFAEGDLNFNPVRGKEEETVTSATSFDTYDSPTSDLVAFTPQFSGNIGAQIDFKTIKNSLKNSLPRNYSDNENIEPYINPQGDFTFEQIYDDNSNRMPSIWNTGISPNFNRMSLEAETPEEQFNWINDNTEQLQSYPYKYGGNFKNIFRNYRKK